MPPAKRPKTAGAVCDSGGRGKRSKPGLKKSVQEATQSSSSSSSSSSEEEEKQTIKKNKVGEKETAKVLRAKAAADKQKVIESRKPQAQAAEKDVGKIHKQSSSSSSSSSSSGDSDSSEDEVGSQPTASEKKRATPTAATAAKKTTAPKEMTKKSAKVSVAEPKTTVKVREGERAVLFGFAVTIPIISKYPKYWTS